MGEGERDPTVLPQRKGHWCLYFLAFHEAGHPSSFSGLLLCPAGWWIQRGFHLRTSGAAYVAHSGPPRQLLMSKQAQPLLVAKTQTHKHTQRATGQKGTFPRVSQTRPDVYLSSAPSQRIAAILTGKSNGEATSSTPIVSFTFLGSDNSPSSTP